MEIVLGTVPSSVILILRSPVHYNASTHKHTHNSHCRDSHAFQLCFQPATHGSGHKLLENPFFVPKNAVFRPKQYGRARYFQSLLLKCG